jgi:NAD(P)-dependent dehydrogenase (short-subunit alcohol dehydrogenase family)
MDGKIAIVSGTTQGLGSAVACLFAKRGAAGLVICGRNEAKGRAKVDVIKNLHGTKAAFVPADLTKVEDCEKIVAECDRAFGRVDSLSIRAEAQLSIRIRRSMTRFLPSIPARHFS